jgi:two-component system, OmpR family, sensor kinase
VSKSWDINLLKSEQKTLLSFLSLYIILVLCIVMILGIIYYNFQKDLMLQEKRLELSTFAKEQILRLKSLHVNFATKRKYPRNTHFQSAIYDSDKKLIFSTCKTQKKIALNQVIYLEGKQIYFIKELESYYLGAKYLVLCVKDNQFWLKAVNKNIVFYGAIFLLIAGVLGFFLVSLLLRPMRDAIELLDRFIKDTTHELNTPVNAILSNIEMIDKTNLDEKLVKKINRIDIGARTVSNLYQDLTYLVLSHKIISHKEQISLQELLEERIEYFSLFATSRKIEFISTFKQDVSLHVDRKKLAKLFDNILSNAIKYNKVNGRIFITLFNDRVEIKDTGRGIAKEKLDEIFQRYKRVDESVGGFGIGLSIVMMIAQEYDFKITMESKEKEWTKVSVRW